MIDSEIFGQIKPWKDPHGENQSEREKDFIMLQDKKSDINLQSKIQLISTQKNNPAVCLGFRAIAASISVQILLEKCARNISKYRPSKTVPAFSESVLYGQHLMLLYDLDFCANKYRMLPWEMWCTHLKNCACFFLGNRGQNHTVRMAINVAVPLLNFRASNKCRPYTPRFLCQLKISLSWCLENHAHSPFLALSSSFSSQE